MPAFLNIKRLKEEALVDLLATETKKLTQVLSAGIQQKDLDYYSYTIRLLIREIKLRKGKAEQYG